jgi:hypothetical protein
LVATPHLGFLRKTVIIGRNVLKQRAEEFGADNPDDAPLCGTASTVGRGSDDASWFRVGGFWGPVS